MAFKARYRGQCVEGDVIMPGDEVTYEDSELVHVRCRDGDPIPHPSRPTAICDRCWLQKPCDCPEED